MKTAIPFAIMILIVGACLGGAETVSLKGVVKKTGGTTGIAGVKVSLVKLSGLSATTGADGAFTLSGGTATEKPFNYPLNRFNLRSKEIQLPLRRFRKGPLQTLLFSAATEK
jgi:hypothetical protein